MKKDKNIPNVPNLRFEEFCGEWETSRFEEFYSFQPSNSLSRDQLNYDTGIVYNIHYGDVHTKLNSLFDFNKEEIPFINSDEDVSKIKEESYLQIGDLIIADASENYDDIGKTIEIENIANKKILAGLHTFLARKYSDKIGNGFVLFLMQSPNFRLQMKRIAQGTKVLSISKGRVAQLSLITPKIEEQRKITSLLKNINQRITTQRQLIKEYQLLKKGLLQKIFKQELSFKEIMNENYPKWLNKKVEEIFFSVKGKGLNKDSVVENGEKKCILYGELYTTYSEVISKVISQTNSSDGINSKYGDLLIPCSTTTTALDLANATALLKGNVLLGGDISILRPKQNNQINSEFFAYYLSHQKKYDLAKYGQGTTIVHLYFNHFKVMNISLPCLKEQQKIANTISSIDKKINLETQYLQQLKDQKQFLLQNMFV